MSSFSRNYVFNTFGVTSLLAAVLWVSHLSRLSRDESATATGPSATDGAIAEQKTPVLPGLSTTGEAIASQPNDPVELDANATAVLSEQVELNQLTDSAKLDLTPAQLQMLAAITDSFQETRRSYEASIAQIETKSGPRLRIVVPTYVEVGDKLRTLYYQQLSSELGLTLTTQIQQKIGAELETRFADFGGAEQNLEIAIEEKSSGREYTVNSTAYFWPNPTSTDTLAVRRETHLLPIENFGGQDWGAFLNLFASQT